MLEAFPPTKLFAKNLWEGAKNEPFTKTKWFLHLEFQNHNQQKTLQIFRGFIAGYKYKMY